MADGSRLTFTPTWPTCAADDCTGRRVDTSSACLEHLRGSELDLFLDRVVPGGDLDLRGTTFSPKLLDRLLLALSRNDGPRIGRADFSYCTFQRYWEKDGFGYRAEGVIPFEQAVFGGAARFSGATFEGAVSFYDTSFKAWATFEGAVFRGRVNFYGVEVDDDALFAEARFEEDARFGLSGGKLVDLRASIFVKAAVFRVRGRELSAYEARFEAGVELQIQDAAVSLERTYFGAPSSVSGVDSTPRLLSLQGTDVSELTIADVDLSRCRFSGAHQLDKLRLEGWTPFAEPPKSWRWGRRQVLAEEHPWRLTLSKNAGWADIDGKNVGAERLAVMYRSLRKALEDGKNEAGAGDFYYGEMEARRHSRTTKGGERAVLWAYWLLSGYGQRASRAFGALAVLVGLLFVLLTAYGLPDGTALQQMIGTIPPAVAGQPQQVTLEVKPGPATLPADRWTADRMSKAVRIALGSVVFREADQRLTPAGVWTVMAGRAFGPLLLALAVLAIRARVKR
ncbi:pentapeptide repeat-containing protein [Lentzea sp. NPDC058450]|uniref:pentapeptide repeat-containing protein n=1 Tax=Lentzea sp. NPDC058450 TaxID=3346505 RepID=UPI003652922D